MSLLLVPVCGLIVVGGLLLGVGLGFAVYRIMSRTASVTVTVAAVAGAGAGLVAFVIWCVIASSLIYLIGTILANRT